MNEPFSPKHPLFDPASLYSRMRATIRAEDKMRGYFHWLQARAKRAPELSPAQPRSTAELRDLACELEGLSGVVSARAGLPNGRLASQIAGEDGLKIKVLDAVRVRGWGIALGITGEPRKFQDAADLLITQEEDGRRTVGLLWGPRRTLRQPEPKDGSEGTRPTSLHCRVFLVEPEVAKRLSAAIAKQSEVAKDAAISQAFTREVVANNLEVARILSALPELEGNLEFDRQVVQFRRLPIPDGCDTFPPRAEPLEVMIVLHPATEEETPATQPT